jgi:cytosine/adenosine deaminase-related metal-dependent hydrolase
MTRILIRNADVLVTMDDGEREIADGAIAFQDGVITAVGTSAELAVLAQGAEVIDAPAVSSRPVWSTRITTFTRR